MDEGSQHTPVNPHACVFIPLSSFKTAKTARTRLEDEAASGFILCNFLFFFFFS